MIIIATHGVELNNHIYRKGEKCDYSGEIDQRIVDNFCAADGSALVMSGKKSKDKDKQTKTPPDDTQDKIKKTVDVMGRDGIARALDGMGVTYSPRSKTEYLAKLLLMSKGEIEE